MNVILLDEMLAEIVNFFKMLVEIVMLGVTKQTNIFYNAYVKSLKEAGGI